MRESRLGVVLQKLGHGGNDPGVVPRLEPLDPLGVGLPRLGGPDMRGVAGLVRTQFPQ